VESCANNLTESLDPFAEISEEEKQPLQCMSWGAHKPVSSRAEPVKKTGTRIYDWLVGPLSHPVLEGKPNANHVRARISYSRTQQLHNMDIITQCSK
jgi:hypothetical protein